MSPWEHRARGSGRALGGEQLGRGCRGARGLEACLPLGRLCGATPQTGPGSSLRSPTPHGVRAGLSSGAVLRVARLKSVGPGKGHRPAWAAVERLVPTLQDYPSALAQLQSLHPARLLLLGCGDPSSESRPPCPLRPVGREDAHLLGPAPRAGCAQRCAC